MLKRMLIMLAAVVVVIAGLGFIKFQQIQAAIAEGASFAPPPASVTTFEVSESSWQPVLRSVGSVNAVNGVVVSTDLPGIVQSIDFTSGVEAKAGQVLIRLDARQEAAQLNAAKARLDLARVNLDRQEGLLKKRVASQSDYDSASAEYKQAQAAVIEVQALIERKTIRAPFDGLLGIREVNLGEYLESGSPVVPLQSLDPIYVNFSLPQQHFAELVPGRKVQVLADGLPGEKFSGEITAIDPNVDESTRNVRVQATLANPDGKLRSGMFVQVELLLPPRDGILAVPASSVSFAPYGNSVFAVETMENEQGEEYLGVRQQFVKTGTSRGDLVEIATGLKTGDTIVSSGVFKLQNNAPVIVNNDVQPGAELSPTPEDN